MADSLLPMTVQIPVIPQATNGIPFPKYHSDFETKKLMVFLNFFKISQKSCLFLKKLFSNQSNYMTANS
jgi:hypothetical protein